MANKTNEDLREIFYQTTERVPNQARSTYVSPDGRYTAIYTAKDEWTINEHGVILGKLIIP